MSDETLLKVMHLAQKGYCCSQIILLLGLELQGREDKTLIRAASGLCQGIGGGRHTCGALTGAACLLGLHAGKGRDSEEEDERLPLMLETMENWFAEHLAATRGGTACQDILGESPARLDPEVCGRLVAETLDQCLTILLDQGFDLQEDPDG